MKQFKDGAILDEVQRVPVIFRYLQGILDQNRARGQYILTGSNNFLLQEQVSQSLAGRAGYLSLLPLSYAELVNAKLAEPEIARHILTGGYPNRMKTFSRTSGLKLCANLCTTRCELLRNITNLALFTRFIHLCANHVGDSQP